MSKQDIATQIIYQYASMLDAKNFSDLPTIMWNDFSLTGPYELNSLEIFMGAVEQNLGAYQKPCTLLVILKGDGMGISIPARHTASPAICLKKMVNPKS